MPAKQNVSIYQLKVTLKRVRPPIWRRIQVEDNITLHKLHQVIQLAMGWTNSHLHQFIANGVYYGEPGPNYDLDDFEVIDEEWIRLNQIASRVKDKFVYEYDFGDDWEHEIVVEKILEPEERTRYPRCITGKRNCPPEDVGGVWGYDSFLEALQDENHPEHKEYMEWIGRSFDPEAFDLAEVDRILESKYVKNFRRHSN